MAALRLKKRKYPQATQAITSSSDSDIPTLNVNLPKISAGVHQKPCLPAISPLTPISRSNSVRLISPVSSNQVVHVNHEEEDNESIVSCSETGRYFLDEEEFISDSEPSDTWYPGSNPSIANVMDDFLSDLSSDEGDFGNGNVVNDYNTILEKLSRDWLLTEISHNISQTCNDLLWNLSLQVFPKLIEAKKMQNIKKKVPQFTHIRRELYKHKTPEVKMDFAFEDKETGEVILVEKCDSTPTKDYPPNRFKKLYEIASVEASEILKIHKASCLNAAGRNQQINLSLDGVSESKSTNISMDVFTIKMKNCKNINPARIVRPLGQYKVSNRVQFKLLLDDVIENQCLLEKIIADNPKRSILRCSKSHSGYFACEYCFAKGVLIQTIASQKQTDLTNKAIEKETKEIREKIDFMKQQPESEIIKENIALLEKLVEEISKKRGRKFTQIVWPSSTSDSCPLRTKSAILEILSKIEKGEDMTLDERQGIMGKSDLLDLYNFDMVTDLPAEYMHCGCLGLIKRLIELTFKVGDYRPRNTSRKLTPPSKFNELIRAVKVLREFSRRVRDLDFAVLKAQEFRNLAIIFFPIILGNATYSDYC